MRRISTLSAVGALLVAGVLALSGCAQSQPGSDTLLLSKWQSSESGLPYIEFADDGTFGGSDGCNGISGTYTRDGDTVTLVQGISTMKGCIGVDTWLSKAHTITVGATMLTVFDKSGAEIGALSSES